MSPDDGAAEEALGDEVPGEGKEGKAPRSARGDARYHSWRKEKESLLLLSDIDCKIMARLETES